ncbi:MAG: NAD(P)H-hydrate dehydratase [Chloroflexota bacterium]|nr:NAD(P)H-hydrate dehydratase [Chloroflexota bacterium]
MKVVTVDQMQQIEAEANAAGHSYSAMMERAGRSVAEAVEARQAVRDRHVLVLVGPGNNGGDGLVAARYLGEAGAHVTCYLYRERSPAEDENFRLVLEGDGRAVLAEEDREWERLGDLVRKVDVLIDAFLGTGTRLPLRGELADMLGVVGAIVADRRQPSEDGLKPLIPPLTCSAPDELFVVGVDGPTGLEYDTGGLDDLAIPADLTVTFAYPKVGHFRLPGAGALGELIVADIGVDPALANDVTLEVVTPALVREWLPARPPDAHKGTFGRAMIVAGSVNYTGAAYLAAASATRAGAGLVTLALPSAIHSAVAASLAEATYLLLPHAMGVLSPDAVRVLQRELEGYDAMLVGPGLGREAETSAFIEKLLGGGERTAGVGFLSAGGGARAQRELPRLVVDADGLNILSEMDRGIERLPPESILTPHPGEMARLMGSSVADVQEDRVAVARSRAAEWGQIILLKGAHTVVAGPDGQTVLEPFANPGLATAGTGDVLAGTIVALRAQGLEAFEAAAAGAYIHGLAGELARQRIGVAGMVAGDVLAYLPEALRRVAVT